jgi:hypothetical protein
MPLRCVSIHQNFEDSPAFRVMRAVNTLMMRGADSKMRLQIHLGDDWMLRCKLLGYGIPMECTSNEIQINNGKNVK